MTDFLSDFRYAVRMLAKSPGFTAIAVLTLALGIGANTAVFSVLHGVLLRPLPFREADRLVILSETAPKFERMSVAYLNLVDWRAQSRSFERLAGFRYQDFNLTGSGDPERLSGRGISAGFFAALGVTPLSGREFTPEDDRPGAARVAMIGESLWKRRFGGQPAEGQSVVLNGIPHTVVGVVPGSFRFPVFGGGDEIWAPMGQGGSPELSRRDFHPGIFVLGRLKDGVSLEQARADMALIAAQLAAAYPATNKEHGVRVAPMKDFVVGDAGKTLWVLLGAVAFVLLIGCLNVANLLLARSSARRTEVAIRGALGAGRRRIVRQFLTESLVLALAGGALGLLIAIWSTGALLRLVPPGLPRSGEIRIDGGVLVFTLLASILTGLAFGLIPALQTAAVSPLATLKEAGRGLAGGRHRLRDGLAVAEIALALVLLAGASLMVRSMINLNQASPGLDPRNVLTFSVALSSEARRTAQSTRDAFEQLLTRIESIPGIEAVAMNQNMPLSGSDSEAPLSVVGRPRPRSQGEMIWANFYTVTPAYLKVMKIPLLRGRFFDEHDKLGGKNVIVVDDVLARAVFPGEDPIGKQMQIEGSDAGGPREIVGVVGHVKHFGAASDATDAVRNACYMPFGQIPDLFVPYMASGLSFAARTRVSPLALEAAVRAEVIGAGRDQPVYDVGSMEDNVRRNLMRQRFSMVLLGVFAGLALVLACVGIYGLMSYSVSQRTHEIGIRMALGARGEDLVRQVVRHAALLAGIGIAVGLGAALALTRALSALLYGISPNDALTFFGVAGVLGAAALAAAYVPARRAAGVDPMSALRFG